MITGTHIVLFSTDVEADRAFVSDVLGFPSVDAGEGWLIFRLPPAEVAFHPRDHGAGSPEEPGELKAELYLMCDDVSALTASLATAGVGTAEIADRGWGLLTSVVLPSGGTVGLYQPRHPTALELEPGGAGNG